MQEESIASEVVLSVKNIQKSYKAKGKTNHVLKGISFEINKGDVVALLGKNGAGKTTLIKCLTGLLDPDRGEVIYGSFDGKPFLPGLLLEGDRNFYLRLTVQQNLVYFGILKGLTKSQLKERIPVILEDLGLMDKRYNELKSLSRGMKQKVGLASCLIAQPQLIFLDEPTLGLDVESKTYLRSKIIELSRQGHALLISSHELGFIEDISTRVLFMSDGMIREVTDQVFALGLEQAPMVITLVIPLTPEMSEALQKISADIKLEESSIEVPDYVFKKVIDCLDTKTIQSVVRKTPSLESLFLTTPSNKVTNLEKEVIL